MAEAQVKALKFHAALRLLPKLNGEDHEVLNTFINECDFIIANIEEQIKHIILQALISQLSGKAEEAVRYKVINSIDNLKAH